MGFMYNVRVITPWIVGCNVVTGAFSGTECLVEGMRDPNHESTWWNAFYGGCATGLIMGAKNCPTRPDVIAGSAIGVGLLMAMFEFVGQNPLIIRGPRYYTEEENNFRYLTTEEDLKKQYPEFRFM
jgi:hypothetical protein